MRKYLNEDYPNTEFISEEGKPFTVKFYLMNTNNPQVNSLNK